MQKLILLGSLLLLAGCGGNTTTTTQSAAPSQQKDAYKLKDDDDQPILVADSGVLAPPAKKDPGVAPVYIQHRGIQSHPDNVDDDTDYPLPMGQKYQVKSFEVCGDANAPVLLDGKVWTAEFFAGTIPLFTLNGNPGNGKVGIKYLYATDKDKVILQMNPFDRVRLTVRGQSPSDYPNSGGFKYPLTVQFHYCGACTTYKPCP